MFKVLARKQKYSEVEYDINGWADAKRFRPEDFDLCYLKCKGGKNLYGWAVGMKWDGPKIKEKDEVEYWKKKPD